MGKRLFKITWLKRAKETPYYYQHCDYAGISLIPISPRPYFSQFQRQNSLYTYILSYLSQLQAYSRRLNSNDQVKDRVYLRDNI